MSFITESKKVYQQVKLNELNTTKDGKYFSVNYRKKDEPESMKYKKVFTDKQRALDFEKEIKSQGHIVEQITEESDDHEVSMARGELEGIADKAIKLSSLLKSKSDAGNPIEAWVQSKITKAAEMVNSVHDYMVYNPEVNEAIDLKSRNIGGGLISQAKAIAKKFADNYTKAYNEIEKLQKGLTQNAEVQRALMQYNEEVELDEIKISDIHKMQQDGKSAEDIAKELNLSPVFVKRILGEDREWTAQSNAKILNEFNDAQIALLKKEFDPLKNKQISTARANQLSNILDKLDDGSLQKLRDALIPFVSAVSAAKLTTRKFKGVKITNVKVPGLEGMAEENEYVAVHVKKGKTSVTANSSYEAAKKASEKFGLKNTIGVTVMLAKKDGEDVIHKATEENESFKDNVIKKIVKPIQDYNKKKEEPKKEEVEITETHFAIGQNVIYHGPKNPITPIKAKIIGMASPQVGAYYFIKKADGENTYAAPEQMKLDEAMRIVNEGVYKDIGVRKGDLKIAKDKRQALKDKYNAIMAGQATGDEHALGDQIRKLDMSIKKQEQELIDIMKKTGTLKKNEEKRLYVESLSALKDKAEKSGMPYNILKQVYNRGMAAWKSGHRPGAGQHQWALARVNSFVTKSSGTWGGADKDLAKKVKGD